MRGATRRRFSAINSQSLQLNELMKMDVDDVRNQSSRNAELLVALALCAFGAYFAFVMLGAVRLDPTSTLWLDQGDIAQHYLGWHFFRGEPWMLPLGANPRYGLDMGSSIVFTDSIPLLAMAFKAVRTVLPAHFQYAGLWMAFCFVAQGLSALLLLKRFSRNPVTVQSQSGTATYQSLNYN